MASIAGVRGASSRSRPGVRSVAPLAATLLVCAFGCAGLLLARRLLTGGEAYEFLAWNLFLAGVPFGLALLALAVAGSQRSGPLVLLALAALLLLWLLFFPNAPYMVTDLTRLPTRASPAPRWFDAMLFGAFAATGVTSGLASLLIVHGLLRDRLGRVVGWAAVVMASLLGGYGICLGRFARLNSWDALSRPRHLLAVGLEPLRNPLDNQRTAVASVLYAAFIFMAYAAILALLTAGRALLPEKRGGGREASRR